MKKQQAYKYFLIGFFCLFNLSIQTSTEDLKKAVIELEKIYDNLSTLESSDEKIEINNTENINNTFNEFFKKIDQVENEIAKLNEEDKKEEKNLDMIKYCGFIKKYFPNDFEVYKNKKELKKLRTYIFSSLIKIFNKDRDALNCIVEYIV